MSGGSPYLFPCRFLQCVKLAADEDKRRILQDRTRLQTRGSSVSALITWLSSFHFRVRGLQNSFDKAVDEVAFFYDFDLPMSAKPSKTFKFLPRENDAPPCYKAAWRIDCNDQP